MSEENKKKAVDINVESLKLYITLSTISIAGLLTFFSKLTDPIKVNTFYLAILLFLLCSIDCIIIINHFIIQANNSVYNVRSGLSRIANFIAIIFFLGAVIMSGIFITNNSEKKGSMRNENSAYFKIENHKIYIGNNFKQKVKIEIDTLNQIENIHINYDK